MKSYCYKCGKDNVELRTQNSCYECSAPPRIFKHNAEAVVRVRFPKGGCWVYPDVAEQDLCEQHLIKGQDAQGLVILKYYAKLKEQDENRQIE